MGAARADGDGADEPAPGTGWVLPWWLDHQRDPASPAYTVGDPHGAERNTTGRTWTLLGTLEGSWRPAVDPAGMFSPGAGRAGIDWWVRSGDAWIHPSRHRAVRQRAIDGTPAVETRLRIGGGDVVHRVAVARVAGGSDLAVVEIENDTPGPIAVAVVLRPFDLRGAVAVGEVSWDQDQLTLRVDGHAALRFPRPPGEVVTGDGTVDVTRLLGGVPTTTAGASTAVRSAVGRALAAVVHPLVHTSALRVVVGPPPPEVRRLRRRRRRSRRPSPLADPATTASVASVAAGWRAQTERTTRWLLPEGPVATAFEAARRHLLLFGSGADVVPRPYLAPEPDWAGGGAVVAALSEVGYRAEADRIVGAIGGGQHAGGQIGDDSNAVRATASAVVAATHHWRLHRREPDHDLAAAVAGAVEWLARLRRRAGGGDDARRGLLPPTTERGWSYLDSAWTLRAFHDAADLLEAGGERAASADAARLASDLRVDLMDSVEAASDAAAEDEMPPAPDGESGEPSIEMLALLVPLRVLPADHRRLTATLEAVRARVGDGPAVHRSDRPRGLSVVDTAQLAAVEVARGDRAARRRVRWLASSASATGTWPVRVHPRSGTGTAGDGHDGRSTAAYVRLVRSMLVGDDAGRGRLELGRMWMPEWVGQGVEVHDAPTTVGRVSYAVRWHAERPALLWEVAPHDGVGQVRISAPGLDGEWSTDERSGEALLGPWKDDGETSGPPGGIGRPLGPASSPPGDTGPEGPDVGPDGSFA